MGQDTNSMAHSSDRMDAALALYLDFLNLFVLILQILMSFAGGRNRD